MEAADHVMPCSVCLLPIKDPRLLPCGHAFCGPGSATRCVLGLATPDDPRVLRCGECRAHHQVTQHQLPAPFDEKHERSADRCGDAHTTVRGVAASSPRERQESRRPNR